MCVRRKLASTSIVSLCDRVNVNDCASVSARFTVLFDNDFCEQTHGPPDFGIVDVTAPTALDSASGP
ncbi:hypothetical protein ONZ51_g14 [Trametes cubensis]|uniref:Uncharacterized protein n=1 Tax=Trametes cubensis TaxID=1111947 RepID=A0AAD7U429_9APHY|nr:hypothetical protein ONZ51_g14 [Trametes cubensis]